MFHLGGAEEPLGFGLLSPRAVRSLGGASFVNAVLGDSHNGTGKEWAYRELPLLRGGRTCRCDRWKAPSTPEDALSCP